MPLRAANKVFFAVYDHQFLRDPSNPDSAPLALQAPLDNKGYNKSIPTNCLVCHGISSRYTPVVSDGSLQRQGQGRLFPAVRSAVRLLFSARAHRIRFRGRNRKRRSRGSTNSSISRISGSTATPTSCSTAGTVAQPGRLPPFRAVSSRAAGGTTAMRRTMATGRRCISMWLQNRAGPAISRTRSRTMILASGQLTFGSYDKLKDRRVAGVRQCLHHACNAEFRAVAERVLEQPSAGSFPQSPLAPWRLQCPTTKGTVRRREGRLQP